MKLAIHHHASLIILVGLFIAVHLVSIPTPDELVFDEKHYIVDARIILNGDGSIRPEHPPLARLIIAGSMAAFGDNPFGWRIMPVLFGAVSIALLYLICRRLNLSERVAFFVAFLFALENLGFVQSGIAMLDVFSVTFMLASFYLYLRGNWLSSGLFIGLAGLAKLTGFLALPVIALHWLVTNRQQLPRFTLALALAPICYLAILPALDWLIWGKFINPLAETKTMLDVLSASTFASLPSEMLSRPWEWMTQIELITYWPEPHYLAMLSPSLLLLWFPAAVYMAVKLKDRQSWAPFAAAWFTGTYLLWIPASLLTDRISYIFYLYPAVPAIALFTGCALIAAEGYLLSQSNTWKRKAGELLITVVAVTHLGLFIYLSPLPYWGKLVFGLLLYVVVRYYLKPSDQHKLPENP